MEFIDLLFRTYADPTTLMDQVIRNSQFCAFLKTVYKKKDELTRWEFYLHKLSPLDQRSWEEFNFDLERASETTEKPSSEEDIIDTVRRSYHIMKNFNPDERG